MSPEDISTLTRIRKGERVRQFLGLDLGDGYISQLPDKTETLYHFMSKKRVCIRIKGPDEIMEYGDVIMRTGWLEMIHAWRGLPVGSRNIAKMCCGPADDTEIAAAETPTDLFK